LYLDKKGEMMRVIVVAIPVIIVAGILFFATTTILQIGEDSVNREACRDSVLLKERSKILGNTLIDNVVCETNLIEIKSTDKNEIYGEITNEMYDCWYQFGEGKRDFLDNNDFMGSDEWCFVCSRIDFDEDVKDKYSELSMGEFNDFLKTENLPLSSEEITFYEYFYGGGLPNQIGDNLQNSFSVFSTDEPLYVGFLIDKDRRYNAAFWTELGVGVGSIVVCGAAIYGSGGIATSLVASLCARGAIGVGSSILMMSTVKEDYIAGLNIGSGDSIKEWCNENR
jgi:hypothetical protein